MRLGSFWMDDMLRGRRAGIALWAVDVANQAALRNYPLFLGAARTPTGLMDHLSPLAALRAADQARRRVPAYQTLLARSGWRDDPSLSPPRGCGCCRRWIKPPTSRRSAPRIAAWTAESA